MTAEVLTDRGIDPSFLERRKVMDGDEELLPTPLPQKELPRPTGTDGYLEPQPEPHFLPGQIIDLEEYKYEKNKPFSVSEQFLRDEKGARIKKFQFSRFNNATHNHETVSARVLSEFPLEYQNREYRLCYVVPDNGVSIGMKNMSGYQLNEEIVILSVDQKEGTKIDVLELEPAVMREKFDEIISAQRGEH